ncbi:MAG: hypothetical protein E7387_02240 [Ruminococcaceae bacterium]|nr:hypothetical protein [Oscillospiraceae bacterium]
MNCVKTIRDNKGSITAAAAIVLSSIIVLNTVLIDYVYMKTIMSNIPARMKLACNSVLASYDALLADKYGLYGYNTSSDCSAQRDFMKYYDAKESTVNFKGAFTELDIIENQISGLMKIKTPVRITETVFKAFDIISQTDKECDEYSICGKAAQKLSELQTLRDELKIKVEGYYTNDPACVNGYKQEFITTVFESFAQPNENSADILLKQMISFNEQYQRYNNDAALIFNKLKIGADEINSMLSGLKDDADSIRKQTQALLNSNACEKINYNCEVLKERLDVLYSFENKEFTDITQLKSVLNQKEPYTNIKINTIYAENSGEYKDSRKVLTQDVKSKVTSEIFYDDKYVIPSVKYAMLPSIRAQAEKEASKMLFDASQEGFIDKFDSFGNMFSFWDDVSFDGLISDMTSRILIDDYIITYMTTRQTGVSDEKVNNEIEYILCGNESCDKNNDTVEEKLVALRFILNFANIMNDNQRVAVAEAMAAAIAAVISRGAGVMLYKYIIISAWALIDSYMDVEQLIKGESVPLIEVKGETDNKINEIQDYSFYLRLLLLFTDKETKLLRICDMMEINMEEITGEKYNLSGVYNSVCAKAITEFEFISPVLLGMNKTYRREDCCEVSY